MLKYVLSLGAITIDCNPEGREAFHPSWTMRAISAVSNQSPFEICIYAQTRATGMRAPHCCSINPYTNEHC